MHPTRNDLPQKTRARIETRLGDAGTADRFTGVSRDIDQQLWSVEAHQQAAGQALHPVRLAGGGRTPLLALDARGCRDGAPSQPQPEE